MSEFATSKEKRPSEYASAQQTSSPDPNSIFQQQMEMQKQMMQMMKECAENMKCCATQGQQ